ncbi:MAG: single-stranded-DNA-specific exonuclease RecJ [Desulfamplus sp.]|nr:single-stranded-DNA-specific exonuclease RecJ [Desulfamplus sp.]
METRWIINKSDPQAVEKISRILGCPATIATILVNRGVTTPEEAFLFMNPSMTHLKDPFTIKDMKKAVMRIYDAIRNRERILIFGDFDADGITATSLLNDFLCHAGAEVSWYIPHRIKEGFSLKPIHIEMAVEQKQDLIITVDCGSDSFDAVRAAMMEDIDVIITDHHELASRPPPALALVNPKRGDCGSGLRHLAGVGVALYLVIALRRYMREQGFWNHDIEEPNLMASCDLFAIGTIADMVPLKDENRILSRAGMGIIREGKREGLRALAEVSKIDPDRLSSEDISFRIAPRINAAGRMSHGRICVDLLTETDRLKARQGASILDELNKKRQEVEKSIVDDIERRVEREPSILKGSSIVMHSPDWSSGVSGIAASKAARQYCRPVVLISTARSPATGSCRSVNSINIHDCLVRCRDLLENFGGHAMAAGITIRHDNIEKFALMFDEEVRRRSPEEGVIKTLVMDAVIDIREITGAFVEAVESLTPFGAGNPEPIFQSCGLKVVSTVMLGTRHRKMVLQNEGNSPGGEQFSIQGNSPGGETFSIEALQFNIDPGIPAPSRFERIAFKVRMNRFNRKNVPQIIIEDVHGGSG